MLDDSNEADAKAGADAIMEVLDMALSTIGEPLSESQRGCVLAAVGAGIDGTLRACQEASA